MELATDLVRYDYEAWLSDIHERCRHLSGKGEQIIIELDDRSRLNA